MKVIRENTIFVSIASYRDPICNDTLMDLYKTAQFPQNVYVGICQQNKEDTDTDCMNNISPEYIKNISIIRMPHTDAKGPTYARYLCSTLYDNQEFYFQIDSHIKFVKNWDTILIDMIHEIKNKGISKKPVLSHYTHSIDNYGDVSKYNVPTICKSFFHDFNGLPSFEGAHAIDTNGKYRTTPYIAGGMFFCEAYFLDEVAFDPNLDYLFVGEEILHSIRFYTNGWDIFTPKENTIFHEYTRSDKPKIWTDKVYTAKESEEQIKKLLNGEEHSILGVGSARSLEEYYTFAGIDINNKTVSKNFCEDEPLIEKFKLDIEQIDFSTNSIFFKIAIGITIITMLYAGYVEFNIVYNTNTFIFFKIFRILLAMFFGIFYLIFYWLFISS